MPTLAVNGVQIGYEVCGSGIPLVLLHEYATDMRAWEAQVRFFSRFYCVIRFNNRGYPPSTVPCEPEAYHHERLIEDLGGFLDALAVPKAFLVGIATGGNLALNFALRCPERVLGLVTVGPGAGTTDRENWLRAAVRLADAIKQRGVEAVVEAISAAPQRLALKRKDPNSWEAFLGMMRALDPVGAEHLMRVTLTSRAPVTDLGDAIAQCRLPILVMVGDGDTPAEQACRFIAAQAPHAGLVVLPNCGHTLNLEEPALFNQLVFDFLAAVHSGRWGTWKRDEGHLK